MPEISPRPTRLNWEEIRGGSERQVVRTILPSARPDLQPLKTGRILLNLPHVMCEICMEPMWQPFLFVFLLNLSREMYG